MSGRPWRGAEGGGIDVKSYALDKALPEGWLRDELGLRDIMRQDLPAVVIPYRDQDGAELVVRYRVAMNGSQPFRWPQGTPAKGLVYGLERRKRAVAEGSALLVEGESDVQTAALHELVAFGIPGVSNFDDELTSPALEGIERLVFIREPGEAAGRLLEALRRSRLRDRVWIATLGEHKDVSELHLALGEGREAFRAAIGVAIEAAVPLEPSEEAQAPAEPFRIDVYSAKALSALPKPTESSGLVGPFLRRARITLLGGPTGQGKTTFGAQMLAAGANGGEFLGYEVEGGLLELVLDLEQHLEDIQEQLDAVGLANSDLVDYAPIPEGLQIDRDPEHLAGLERIVAAKPYDVVRIDPFYKLHAGDSSDEEQARALVHLTRRWVNEYGFALLMDTHVRKRIEGSTGFKLDDLFGSSLFARDPEIILGLQLIEDGLSRLHVFKARGRSGEIRTGQTIDLLYSDERLFRHKPDVDERDIRGDLLDLAGDHAWRTLKEWKAKPGDRGADPSAPNYLEFRGGIGARQGNVKAELLALQREELFEYEEGPPGRSAKAKCWRLRPTDSLLGNPPGQCGSADAQKGLDGVTDSLSPTDSAGVRDGESVRTDPSTDSLAWEHSAKLDTAEADEWSERIRRYQPPVAPAERREIE